MNILHIVPTYYPAVRYGGPIRSVHELAKSLADRGHEVHVYTTNVDGPFDSDVVLGQPVEREGVRVWYFPTGAGRRPYRSPQMGRALRANIAAFDIVHLHSVFLWPTTAAARAARASRTPYIVAPRGMLVGDLIRRKSAFRKRAWIALFERGNIERAAAVHVTAEIEAEELTALGFKPRRIAIVPNGVDIVTAYQGGPNVAPLNGEEGPFVLFIGQVNWKKGIDRLIKAMAHVNDASLIIAGIDEDNYQSQLEDLARKTGVAGKVRFIGPVEGSAKWVLLREAQLLALPSYSENFGIVVLEAMAAGCPVVVTPEVGLAPAVREAGAGIVIEGEPLSIAKTINTILQDRDARVQMGQAGQRIARERFSWNSIAEQMERVYAECAERRST